MAGGGGGAVELVLGVEDEHLVEGASEPAGARGRGARGEGGGAACVRGTAAARRLRSVRASGGGWEGAADALGVRAVLRVEGAVELVEEALGVGHVGPGDRGLAALSSPEDEEDE